MAIKQDYVVSGDCIFIALCVLVALTIWSLIGRTVVKTNIAVLQEKICWVEEQLIQQNELRAGTYQKKIIEKD